MTSVAEAGAAPSEFQRRGALFRNVVIISSILGSLLLGVGMLPGSAYVAGEGESHVWPGFVVPLEPLLVLTVLWVIPHDYWRLVGLAAFVFTGYAALFVLLCLWICLTTHDYQAFRDGYMPASLFLFPFTSTVGCAAVFISWLYLGRYCRGWAREFAAAKQASSAGAGNQGSAQKEGQ
jgi:hypothetical protein